MMYRWLLIKLLSFLSVFNYAIAIEGQIREPQVSHNDIEQICIYLKDNLWERRDASDAAMTLLVPLEYAYLAEDKVLQKCFSAYVARMQAYQPTKKEDVSVLSWLEHLHLISRYVVLSKDYKFLPWLKEEFITYWAEQDAWIWAREPFKGISQRLEWKLNTPRETLSKSYYNVIFDEDYFALTLGVDLYGIFNQQSALGDCSQCLEAKNIFLQVFSERLTWFDGNRWLIDVGAWAEHPDWGYAAYLKEPKSNEGTILPKRVVSEIAVDSSHAVRFPSWLRSAELAFNGKDREYIRRLRKGLEAQLLEKVIVKDTVFPVPILRNYMSGHNGYYRYGYASQQGYFYGYPPYALSGTFAYGGWSLLGQGISDYYLQLSNAYPLSDEVLQIYSDSSTRTIHPLLKDGWQNGLLETIAKMAVYVSRGIYKRELN